MNARTTHVIAATALVALALSGCAAEQQQAVAAKKPAMAAAPARTAGSTPSASPTPTPTPTDTIERKTVRVAKPIPFSHDTVQTASLDRGVTVVDQAGKPGVRVRVLEVTYKNGVEVGRRLVSAYVKKRPTAQVKLVGTHVDPPPTPAPAAGSGCDPNYAGACVPIASDVDCAGGSGDGPEYVEGPVRVVGDDIYDLNRDDDDIACDS